MHIRIHNLRIKILLGFLLSCFAMQAQVAVPFTIRYQDNIKGDITQISNNIVNRHQNGFSRWEKHNGVWNYVTYPELFPEDAYTQSWESTDNNDNYDMEYIDIDSDPLTFSSSSATLSAITDVSCSTVVYAALYWSATYRYNTDDSTSGRATDFNQIKLKLPGSATYTDINGTTIYDGFGTTDFGSNSPYVCYANITALVAGLANPNGTYTAANIRASEADLSGGVSGGWTIFIVYENPNMPGKYVTSYDGFAGVKSSLASIDVNYTGFTTVPAPLPVRAKLMACALEGDKGISGDQLQLKDASAASFTQLSNGLNPATNFFNGSITYLDAANVAQPFTDRVPNSSNTLGYDADIININQGLIANSSTGATLRITSTQDTYFLFFNSLAVDIIEPEIQLIKTVEDLAGNDIGGADVNLGDYLEYVISFQNLGNDDATSFTITDLLPNNTYFNQVDVSGAPGVTYVYNPGTEQITFTIPDNLVEEDDPAYEIRLRVRVAESCNDLKDACSNIIQNSAYATYQGILNSNVISNDPSIAGLNGCGQPVTGPANFLVDIDDCNFQRTVTLCSGPITVTASNGYSSYTWYDSNDVQIGNTQSIDLTEGDYYVVCVAPAPCVSITEYVTVNNFSDLYPNPVLPFADELAICTNNGLDSEPIPNIFLCGIDDERLIQTGITDATNISWQKLNEGDCIAACPTCDDLPDDCPWAACPESTWGVVGTGQDFVADTAGRYRLKILYEGCQALYYFNVFKNNLDPQFTKENIICTADGNITVTNVPAGYEYQLVDQTTNTVIYDYADGMGPSFDITASGIYTVNIRQQGVDTNPGNTYCEFSLEDIGIQNRALSVNVITEPATCNGLGSIRLQALNVGPQYYFSITGPSSDSHGPVMDNNHLFENLNPGTYNYTVTTDDGCTVTGTATIIDESNLDLVATVSQNISCTEGNIQMNPSGGSPPYTYAIYSKNGVLQTVTPGSYQTSVIFNIAIGDQGDYVFIVMDGNGCTSLSNEVTIDLVPDVEYTIAVSMVSCNGADNGSIVYTLGNTHGYNVSFDLLDASNTPIATNNSGSFTGLAPGDYTVILHQKKGSKSCDFPFTFTITEPDPITGGTASVTQAYDCTVAGSSGATITVDPSTITGGTPAYQYSVDGVNFTSSTTFTGLTAGTYNITVKDANNCTYVINTIVIDPLTPPTDLSFSATTQTCPTLTSDVTLTVVSGTGPFTYQITAPASAVVNNGTNNVFADLSAGTYTFMVTDSQGCSYSENYTINALTPIAVNGQPVSNVTCFGAADGSLNFNVSGFSTNYQYTIVNGASATVGSSASATAGTIPLTGLVAETYTITVTDNVTNCTATASVTISQPATPLAITPTSNPITCVANGSVSVAASGGWGGYQYILTQPDLSTVGPQSGSSFTGLTQAGTYTVTVRDANNCSVTATFTLTTPVPPTASLTGSDICYDANGASLTVTVTGGTAPFTYSLNGASAQSSNVFSNLTPNTYNITVTDAYGCTATASQTIAPTLTAMAAFTKGLDCTASPDAQISVTINGGTSPYTYEVSADGGGTYGASASVTGSAISYQTAVDGSFRFRITDANGCITETNTTVIAPLTLPSITSISQTQNILCNGESTGALSVIINNTTGTGPYTINVYNTTTSTDYFTQTTGLPAGNYTITVTDANSCTDSQTNVIITEPVAVAFDTTEVPITCDPLGSGVSAGEIIVENVTGGTTPFTYYLSNNFGYADSFTATTNEDHSFAILDYGIYQVTVVDANGCTLIEQNIIMASPPEDMDIDISTLTSDCSTGGTAVVTVNPDVSSNNYSFAVLTTENDPVNIPAGDWQAADSGTPLTSTFTGLIPGVTYTFVVRDNVTGCYYVKAADLPINTPSTLTSTIDVTNNVTCKGNGDGNVDVTIDNFDAGTTQVTYEVYFAQSNQPTGVIGSTPVTTGTPATITGIGPLAPGTYFILFTEVDGANAGCSAASGQFSITESPEVLTVTASVVSNANCNANSGVITAVADGGTAPYQYLILASPVATPPTAATAGWTTSNTFNVDGGDYMVYVMDAYGCIQPISAPITLNTDPSPVIALSVVQQCGVAEGSYSIQVDLTTAGMPPYTYSFNGGAFQAQSGTAFTYTNLVSGTYNVTVRDVNGCTDTQTITVYPPLNLTPSVTAQPTCAGSDGEITVAATGGSSNYEYELQDTANNPIVAANPSNVFVGQDPGDYIVVITDTTTGCSVTAPVTLETPTPVTFTYVSQNVSCNGANDGSIVVTLPASNNNPVYTYTLYDGTNPAVVQNSNIFTGLAVGTYTLTVTSGKDCTAQEIIDITEPNALTLTATATDFACDATNAVTTSTITAIAGAGTAPYTYSIDGTNFFTSNTFEVVDNGTAQNITVTVKDANNCTATFPLTINPLPEILSVVPTLLTAITCTNDETVTITVTGGSGDFTFDLLPLGTQASITPGPGVYTADFDLSAPGSYDFQITDNVTGCYEITSAPYAIAPYDTIEVEATASTQVTCFGGADGTVTIEITGYTGAYDYVVTDALSNTVAIGSSATTTNPFTITGLTAGNLNVTVTATDSPFCSAVSNNITVASPADPLVLNAAETANVTCTNDQGEILATATGGWGSYEFELINNTASTTVQAYGSNNWFAGLAAGNYTVNVRDAGGCIVSQTIDLIQPAPISATINASATLLLCNGDNTATVDVTGVTGGEGVYQYILNIYDSTGTTIVLSTDSQTAPTFNNLGAGTYSITVTDGWSCDLTTPTVTITEPDPIQAFLNLTDTLTCTTQAEITVSATGGTPTYEYSLDGVTYTTQTVYAVGAGTYQIYVRDSNNCAAVLSNEVTVLPVPPLTINLDLSSAVINCFGESTASIVANVTGGLGNYSYELLDGASAVIAGPQSANTFSGLPAGDYYVRVTSDDCEETSPVINIASPVLFTATVAKTDVLCYNENNGSITVTATGGTGTVQYAISPYLNQFVDTNVFTALPAGWYDVIAQDQNGCFQMFQVEILNPALLEAEIDLGSLQDETCLGDSDASITVNIWGGTGDYEVAIDDLSISTDDTLVYLPVTGTQYTFSNLVGGTAFNIYIRDSNGCNVNPPLQQYINPGVDMTPEATVAYSCTNNVPANEVTITVTSSQTLNAADLTYSVDGTTYQASNVFNNLAAGSYTAYVQHTNGCIQTDAFVIDATAPIVIDSAVISSPIECFGDVTGEITVTASGGTGILQYGISTSATGPFIYDAANVFTDLATGTYYVSVTDEITCEITSAGIFVGEPAQLTASVAGGVTDEICLDDENGTVTITISGGTTPYFTSIDSDVDTDFTQDQLVYTNLAAGNHTVYVKDANGCTIVAPIDFTINPGVDIQTNAEVLPLCINNSPSIVVLVGVNTNVSADVEYSIDNITYQTSNEFYGLAPGNYTMYVRHTNGCLDTDDFVIDTLVPISIDATPITPIACFGDATGVITVTASGGTGTLQYAISTSATGPFTYGASNVFNGLATGTYYVSVTDTIDCEITSTGIFVDEPTELTASVTGGITNEICFNDADGTVTVTVSGGTAPYFTSLDSNNPGDFAQDVLTYTGLAAGTHTLYVRDVNNCTIASPITFDILPGVDMTPTATVVENCTNNVPGNEVTIAVASSQTLDPADLTYSVDGTTYQASNVFNNLAPGNYTAYVQHVNGCIKQTTFTINARLPISIDATPITTPIACFGGATGVITVTASGGTGTLQYAISTSATGPFTYGASNVFNGLATGTYYVSVTDAIDCVITSAGIFVDEPTELTASVTGGITNEICFTDADGTVTVTVSGGTAPYFTSLDSNNLGDFAQDVFTYTGLAAGTHTLYVKDVNNCTIASPITFDILPGVDMTPTATVVENCTNNVPGNEVTITVASSQTLDPADLTYSVDGTTYQASNVFNNLAPGNYTAYVQHANGCIKTDTFTINTLQPITIDSAVVTADVLCFGDATGVITVTASGGTGTLQYAISPAFVYGSTNVFTGLTAGTYTVRVTDGIGCEVETSTLEIMEPTAPLTASVGGLTHEICFNTADGTITLTIAGGTAPYFTSLDSNVDADFAQDVFTYTGIAAGDHTVYVKDANDCTVTPIDFTINEGVDMTPTADIVATCSNNIPGNTVTINVASSQTLNASDIQYSLDGTNYQASNVFTNLAPATYTVSVRHTNGCVQTVNFTIDPLQPVSASVSAIVDVACKGETTGSIEITATGGTGTLEYAISPAFTYVSSNVFTDLATGSYTVRVRDSIGCEVEINAITLDEPLNVLTSTIDVITDEICLNAADGTVTITVSGGTAPYFTSLDSSNDADFVQDVFTYTGLTAGTHTVFVKDANDCTIATPLVFDIEQGVDIQASANIGVLCAGNSPESVVFISTNPNLSAADLEYSLDGINYQVSNTFTNLPAGNYTAYVRHTNGCVDTDDFVIDNLLPISIDATPITSAIACFGDATGEITVTASGGTGDLTYAISTNPAGPFTYGTSNVFSDLTTGTYYISVTDAIANCVITTNPGIFVGEPTELTASVTGGITNEICFNNNDGTVTVTVSGGTAPYFTSLDSAAFAQDVFTYTGLTPGTHTIDVHDANNCVIAATLTFDILPGADMTPAATVVDNCTNNVPGNEVTIDVASSQTLDTADLTYSVDGTTYQASNMFNDLAPGNYTAYVQHANGCIETTTFTINALQPIAATAVATLDVLCKGEATGEITVTASGGTGTLQYAISPAYVYGPSNVFTDLPAGTYTVRVTDGIGCEFEVASVTVDEPVNALTSAIDVITDEICFNANDGTVTITVSGGTAPYFTSLDSNNDADYAQDVFTYTGLTAGTHTIFVKDANDCTIVTPLVFDILPGADMTPAATVVDNCTNNVPGNEVTIDVASSQTLNPADLTYSVDGTTYQASNMFNNLAPGNYTAYVQHANGCIETTAFTINALQPIAATAVATLDVLCKGEATGEITVTASGGTGTLQYAISPAYVYGPSNVFTDLPAGTYTVRVTDGIGCEFEVASVTVNEPVNALTSAIDVITDEICFNNNDGTVTITVSGGTAPYFTSLDSNNDADYAQDVFTYTGLTAGTHTVFVKDANDCTIATPLVFDIEQGVDIQASADVSALCTGNTPENVVFIGTNPNISAADLEYSLDGVNYQTDNFFTNLAPGNYTAYVQHTNGCIQTTPFTINALQPISIDSAAVTADVLCFGDATGEITVTASGGTGVLTYAISTDPANYTTNNVFTDLPAGTYTVSVMDEIGCEITTANLTVNEPSAALTAAEIITDEICFNANDGTLTLTVTGGTAPYFTSLDSNNPADFIQDQFVYTNITVGSHTIYVTDSNGCTITPIDFTINPGADMTPTATVVDNCTNNVPGNEVTIDVASSQTLDPADLTYSVDGTNYQASNVFSNLAPGNYTAYVQHANGCIETTTFTINTLQPIAATAVATLDVLCKGEATGEITVTASGGTGTLQYAISPAYVYGPSNVFTDLPAGTYTVRVTDGIGCEFEVASVTVNEPVNALTSAIDVITDEICFNAADGTVTISVSGGTAPYFTSLDSNNDADYVQDVFTYTGLTAGTHTVFVKDANDCTIVTPLVFDILPGADMTPSATVVDNCTNNVPGNEVTIDVASSQTLDPADLTYSVDGTTYQASNVFNNLAPGNYTAYVQHANGCIETTAFTINTLQPITIDTAVVTADVLCFGEATGEITVTASGGTGTLQYAISPNFIYGTNNVFTGLTAGSYTVMVTDGIGCEVQSATLTITEPTTALTMSNVVTTDEICFNATDGTVTFTVNGGTAPYFTSLDSNNPADFVQDVFAYTGLTAGAHTVYVTDSNGCTIAPIDFTINPGADMTPSATVVDNCTNNVPGNEVTIDVASSQTLDPADLTYSIDGTTYQASNVFNNLAPGSYTAYVQHANGCIETTTFTINTLQPITIDTAVVTAGVLCFGEATGEITVTASGGTGTLEYAISPDFIYGTNNVFTGLTAGSYTVMVTDGIGCEIQTATLIVNSPTEALTASHTVTPESCTGVADGTVSLIVIGGTAPYFTSLDSTNPADFVQDVFTYTGLTAGNHTVYVTDSNGCTVTPITFNVAPGVDTQPTVNVVDFCNNNTPGNTVTISVAAQYTGQVQYSIDGITYQASNIYNNLTAGTYTAYVQHVNGCIQTVNFDVEDHQPVNATATVTQNVICFGDDTGEILVTATGGTGQLEYAISPVFSYTTNNTFTSLVAGTYTIKVRDELGCVQTINNVVITQAQSQIVASVNWTNETCLNANDGTVTISVSGGTAPYSTSMDGVTFVQDQFTYSNLGGGQHIVFVQDAAGCSIIPIVFNIEDGVTFNPVLTSEQICYNNTALHMITVQNINANIAGDLMYSIDGVNYQSSNIFTNLPAGTYTVYIQHTNGCIKTRTIVLQNSKPILGLLTVRDALCNSEANGVIMVNGSGGVGQLTYGISPDFVMTAESTFNVPAGTYTVRVQDETGCYMEYTATIDEPEALILTEVEVYPEICENDDNGAILIDITGGTAPYSTSMDMNQPFEVDKNLYTDLDGGVTYTIYVKDANGCIAFIDVWLDAPLTINATPELVYNCDENTLTVSVEAGVQGQVTYSLNGGTPQTSNVFTNLADGTYVVDVLHQSGCIDSTDPVTVENTTPLVLILAETDLNEITATTTGGSGGYTYTFNDNYMGSTNVFEIYATGTYVVTVTDSRGCVAQKTISAEFVDIILPDVMSPNDDGINDTWAPGNAQNYPNLEFYVFDRYGRKLATLKQGQEWDGKYNGKELPTGDYWYIVKLNSPADDREFVGHFTIFR